MNHKNVSSSQKKEANCDENKIEKLHEGFEDITNYLNTLINEEYFDSQLTTPNPKKEESSQNTKTKSFENYNEQALKEKEEKEKKLNNLLKQTNSMSINNQLFVNKNLNCNYCQIEQNNQYEQLIPDNNYKSNIYNINNYDNMKKILGDLKLYPVTIKVEKVEKNTTNIPYIKIKNCNKNNDINRNHNHYSIDREKLKQLLKNENENNKTNWENFDINDKNFQQLLKNPIYISRKDNNIYNNIIEKIGGSEIFNVQNIFQFFSIDDNDNGNDNNIINNNFIKYDENKNNNNTNNKINQNNGKEKTKKQLNLRLGDWACKKCNNLNFAFRDKCNRCGLSKEDVGIEINKDFNLNNNRNILFGSNDKSNNNNDKDYINSISNNKFDFNNNSNYKNNFINDEKISQIKEKICS